MTLRSIVGRFLKTLLILGVSAIAGAQTQTAEPASVPQRGNKQYWLMVDKFADGAVHFAYAKRFVEVHKESLTDRQCQQYSRIAADYADQLGAFRKAGLLLKVNSGTKCARTPSL